MCVYGKIVMLLVTTVSDRNSLVWFFTDGVYFCTRHTPFTELLPVLFFFLQANL